MLIAEISDEENFDGDRLDVLTDTVPDGILVESLGLAGNTQAREALCRILYQRPIPEAVPGIAAFLNDEDVDLREYALEAISTVLFLDDRLSDDVRTELGKKLLERLAVESNDGVLSTVVQLLPFVLRGRARQLLTELASHRDSRVRLQARRGMAWLDAAV